MSNWEFQEPKFLLLLLGIPFLWRWFFVRSKKKGSALLLPSLVPFQQAKNSIWVRLRPMLYVFRVLACVLLLVGLARPRKTDLAYQVDAGWGVDILLAVDVSVSMLAKDFTPNRLSVLKEEAVRFVKNRPADRIGLVAYAGEALTKVPLTLDKKSLFREIDDLKILELDGGTAIGDGLGVAINHLKHSKAKNKVIILMTDGLNTEGFVHPLVVASIAASYGVKVYTIGIGTNGRALFPVSRDPDSGEIMYAFQEVEIDENLMKEIARKTQGKYFRALDKSGLQGIYDEIDRLDRSKAGQKVYYVYDELFRYFLSPALFLLLLEFVCRNTIYKGIL